jgi:RNA polymerase sigma factor (sigma-70 family)
MRSGHQGVAFHYIHQLFGEGTLAQLTDSQLLELYVSHRDELAFKTVVHRHGKMVLTVCSAVVGETHDADDAFQATFMLLIRKAASLWVDDSIGGWLHRVAFRIAAQARSEVLKRRECERRAAVRAREESGSLIPWDDASVVLHQEIDRLPERFRRPIVLCYLDGMTYQEAARHLEWTVTTTQGRLTRARNLLRARLTRRGVTLSGSMLGTVSVPGSASALSLSMLEQTVQAARHFAMTKGAAIEGGSTAAASLAKGALRKMMIAKLQMAAAAALGGIAVTCVATSLAATGQHARATPPTVVRPDAEVAAHTPTTHWTTRASAAGSSSVIASEVGRPRPPSLLLAEHRGLNESTNFANEHQPANFEGQLLAGQRLNRDDSLFSSLNSFRVHMNEAGNLVLAVIDDEPVAGNRASVMAHSGESAGLYNNELWSSGTDAPGTSVGTGSYGIMHDDGNFVIYDANSHPCFETNTAGSPGAFLRCQNDGNLVIYTRDLIPIWHTGTYARPSNEIAAPTGPPPLAGTRFEARRASRPSPN